MPFFISTYSPEFEFEVNKYINALKNRLNAAGVGIHIIDLYDTAVSILENRQILDRLLEKEGKLKKDLFLKQLVSLLDPGKDIRPFITAELEKSNAKMLFLKGIGRVFPFIRAESLLNNLHSSIKNIPVIIFFPGQYQENKLYLFKRERESGIKEPYYRAFNLDEFKV